MSLLDEARQIINEVDDKMARLFVRRMEAVAMVAEHKKMHGLPVLDEAREEQVIRNGASRVEDDELRAYYVNFIRNNMALSRGYQHRLLQGMKVAYSGTEGAYAHIATGKLFPTAERVAFGNFTDAYRAVEAGECDAVVLPIENSSNGEVGQVTDLMFSGNLYINAVYDLAISHDLLVLPGTAKKEIKTVISHPQALGQCGEYIRTNGWQQQEYLNTALAAKLVSETGDASIAAIASEEAAEVFGLEVLERNVNASRTNTTRFAVFSRSENLRAGVRMGEHFILVFTVKNEAGALAKAIDIIGQYGFNMGNLRSRPMKELLWQYYFYIEAEGSIHSEKGQAMLKELGAYCDRLKVVGSYVLA
ncbi:MAG: chorismate mutase [Clostridia bacterium]|nr:chorismate mutase [Clostridia bacterium]